MSFGLYSQTCVDLVAPVRDTNNIVFKSNEGGSRRSFVLVVVVSSATR